MKLGANGGFTKISKSAGSIQRMICWWPKTRGDERKPWKVSKLQRLGSVRMLIFQTHLPTNKCSKSWWCFKPWTAESQVKQSVRRYKLWTRHSHPSNLCEKLWPLTWTCQYKQNKQTNSLPVYSLAEYCAVQYELAFLVYFSLLYCPQFTTFPECVRSIKKRGGDNETTTPPFLPSFSHRIYTLLGILNGEGRTGGRPTNFSFLGEQEGGSL